MVLSCKAPDGQKLQFELQMITRIGRGEDNDIQLFDNSASTHHCELRLNKGVVTVHDLGSTNGIAVDGEPVQEAVLRPGDCLIQRGTRHAWQNRSDQPCILVSTMVAGIRDGTAMDP